MGLSSVLRFLALAGSVIISNGENQPKFQSKKQVFAFFTGITTITTPSRRARIRKVIVPTTATLTSTRILTRRCLSTSTPDGDDNDEEIKSKTSPPQCWNPGLRKAMSILSFVGILDTSYLSFLKLTSTPAFCGTGDGTGGGCNSVLDSSYSTVSIGTLGDVPLALVGLLAYSACLVLSSYPLLSSKTKIDDQTSPRDYDDDNIDTTNRILLLTLTSSMGLTSAYLLYVLSSVLHASCPLCIGSAVVSLSLMATTWFGGALPFNFTAQDEKDVENDVLTAKDVVLSLGALAGVVVVLNINGGVGENAFNDPPSPSTPPTALVSPAPVNAAESVPQPPFSPPPITASSTPRTLLLARRMKTLNAKMYGAYWCSHCYDQKQTFGKEAYGDITYVECDKEGANSARNLCKSKKVPGYPTFEIGGELYPGERSIEELEEIVDELFSKNGLE